MKTLATPKIHSNADELKTETALSAGKTSFLIYKGGKYIVVRTENIALFHIKYESSMIVSFDGQDYFVNHSLDHIQTLLPDKQFFRLNRQYLINFQAIKDVEIYFARKLLVNPVIRVPEKLLVPKERTTSFLNWLDNR